MRNAADILDEPEPPADERVSYGEHPLQFADLRHGGDGIALVVHGGVWRAEYDLAHTGALCAALRDAGVSTANIEYRRVGNGGGWPASLDDVVAATKFIRPDVLVGHSAGGHLALLAGRLTGTRVVGLAAICDPETWDNSGVAAFFGGDPPTEASPLRLSPLGVSVALVHGTDDNVVPIEQSERLAAATDARLVALPAAGHFEPIDPRSPEWNVVRDAVLEQIR